MHNMLQRRSPPLKSLLLVYEIAFVLLLVVTGALGGMWAYFWQQSSRESVRLNNLLFEAQQLRGDLYTQLKEVGRARLLEEPAALAHYQDSAADSARHFQVLARNVRNAREALALDYMRRTYAAVRSEMDKISTDPYLASDAARLKIFDPRFEEWMLAEFESALLIFTEVIARARQALEERMNYWTGLAPWLMPLPVLLALALLLFSRGAVQHKFVNPMRRLVDGTHAVSQGALQLKLDERGVAEVVQLAHSFNAMARDLAASRDALVTSERQAALGALVPVVAHNIRNPLASIRAIAQVLDDSSDKAELAETRSAIIDTVDRLERWVSALLSYLHPLHPRRARVAFTRVVDGALAPLKNKLEEKRIVVTRQGWDDELRIDGDADLLEQAVYGLLNNAVDASPVGGQLMLALAAEAGEVSLTIDDQGPGLPFDPRPRDLTPGPSTKRFGTGLGIPFAFKVCQAHQGSLTFTRRAEGGARVRLTLAGRAAAEAAA